MERGTLTSVFAARIKVPNCHRGSMIRWTEEGEESKISVRDYVEENSRDSVKRALACFLPATLSNQIEQPFYDCLCHGLALARNQFSSYDEKKTRPTSTRIVKPGSDESIRHSEVANMKHWLRRKLHIGFRNLKEARGFVPKKLAPKGPNTKPHQRGLKQE